MKVLVISDDTWHPAEEVEMGLAPLKRKFDMTCICTAKDILTPKYLREFDVVMVCKGDCINGGNHEPWFEEGVTEVMPRDFKRYVEEGGAFIALHAGNCFREGETMTELTGNYFIGHPPRCEVTLHFEHIPLTDGAEDFTERDEHYQIAVIAGDAVPFAHSVSQTGGRQIAGYTRELGLGRVAVYTPGHTLAMLSHPSTQKILENLIAWAGGEEGGIMAPPTNLKLKEGKLYEG